MPYFYVGYLAMFIYDFFSRIIGLERNEDEDKAALNLVMSVLPRISDFIQVLEDRHGDGENDKRRDCWDAIQTATLFCLRHKNLKSRRRSQETLQGMAELAYSLNRLFSDEVGAQTRSTDSVVSTSQPTN